MATTPTKPKPSLFTGAMNEFVHHVGDSSYHFFYRQISPEHDEYVTQEWPRIAVVNLGGPEGATLHDEVFQEWFSKQTYLPVLVEKYGETVSETVTANRALILEMDKLHTLTLLDALDGWDLAEPMNPENIKGLPRMIKRLLAEDILAASNTGVGAIQFFRRLSQVSG